MEGELRPRDIQARVRAGVPVEELASHAGMSPAMVERFAAPVLAERAHMAAAAIAATVRSTNEPAAHRTLRAALVERLEQISLSEDDVNWDSYRRTDGRWLVTARYRVPDAEEDSVAEFLFQPSGRFSVANNDEARGLVGDKAWPPAGEGTLDEEPTVDLADEFALARAVQHPDSPGTPDDPADDGESGSDEADPEQEADDTEATADVEAADPEPDADPSRPAPPTRKGPLQVVPEPDPEPDPEPEPVAITGVSEDASASELDRLFAMLDGHSSEDDGDDQLVSDAAAVPDVATGIWSPHDTGADLEPSLFDDDPSVATSGQAEARPDKSRSRRRRRRPISDPAEIEEANESVEPDTATDSAPEEAAATAPRKRKGRAAVPSWDEIMFGSPRRK